LKALALGPLENLAFSLTPDLDLLLSMAPEKVRLAQAVAADDLGDLHDLLLVDTMTP
jgi:hypothetical protein